MVVPVKSRERRFVRYRVIVFEVKQLFGNRHRPATAAGVIIFDDNVDFRQMLVYGSFKISKPDRLEAHVGVVKILNRWLDEQNFHRFSEL